MFQLRESWCFIVNFGIVSHGSLFLASDRKNMWAHRRALIFLPHMSTWGHVFSSLKIAQMTLLIDSYLLSAYKVPGILVNAGVLRVTRLLPSQELVSYNGKGFEKRKWSLCWNLKEELEVARWQRWGRRAFSRMNRTGRKGRSPRRQRRLTRAACKEMMETDGAGKGRGAQSCRTSRRRSQRAF